MKFLEHSPAGRLELSGTVQQRQLGWVIMDRAGELYLHKDGSVTSIASYWPSRRFAMDFYNKWRGGKRRRGRPRAKPKPADRNIKRMVTFPRALLALITLWESYPHGITPLFQHARATELGLECNLRTVYRDLDLLVSLGFATRQLGVNYTAIQSSHTEIFKKWAQKLS